VSHPFDHIDDETIIDDISGLIPDIGTRRELNAQEAANVRDAVLEYFGDPVVPPDGAEFDFTWMRAVHKAMFGKVWRWAGTRRNCNLNIGVEWIHIEAHLLDLCESIPYFLTTKRLPSQPLTDTDGDRSQAMKDIAHLHYQLVRIHPFLNGNGRWSRFVSNIYQLRFTNTFTRWPDELVGKSGETSPLRAGYIEAMKAVDAKADNLARLAALHDRFTPKPDL